MGSKNLPEIYDDRRLASKKAFFQWARPRWLSYTSRSPLGLRPLRRGYAEVQDEKGRLVELYAGEYPLDAFEDFLDFCLWETYISSLHQSLLRDDEPDLDWFVPLPLEEGIAQAWETWKGSPLVLQGEEIQDWLGDYLLPDSIRWIIQLPHRLARVEEEEDEMAMVFLSATQQGYSVLLAIRALSQEEIQSMFFSPFIDLSKGT